VRDKYFKDLLLRLFHSLGIDIAHRTDYKELKSLISLLTPFNSGFDLIRLGPDGDGGYLIPNDLEGIDYAFSPGVSNESGFELDLANLGMGVFLADYSVSDTKQKHSNFDFTKKFISSLSNEIYITLDEWIKEKVSNYNDDLLLQMDIEGEEFEVITSTALDTLSRFRIIVIEFHYLQELLNRQFYNIASKAFKKLLQTHSVVHIHPNNHCGSIKFKDLEIPRVAEFTFLRNDRFKNKVPEIQFPHKLDKDNLKKRKTLVLHKCWYDFKK
tara:strand:+ start:7827 stop:8636 length:810 start_codon:yes stop_codon:yes gene_type:complete